jgi:hypothetical protein
VSGKKCQYQWSESEIKNKKLPEIIVNVKKEVIIARSEATGQSHEIASLRSQ